MECSAEFSSPTHHLNPRFVDGSLGFRASPSLVWPSASFEAVSSGARKWLKDTIRHLLPSMSYGTDQRPPT